MLAPAPRYPLTAVDNTLEALALLSRGTPLRLIDLAAHLEVAPSTAHRLLAMLEHRGFARRRAGMRSYEAGPAFLEAARGVLRETDLAARAQPILDALARTYQETIFLAVLDDNGARFVAGRESRLELRVGGHVGQTFAAHATASGRILLAALSHDALRARYPADRLPTVLAQTTTRRSALERELARVRTDGYAITNGTNAAGVSAIAVPIAAAGRAPVAALTLVAPTTRFDERRLTACLPALRRAAARIAREAL